MNAMSKSLALLPCYRQDHELDQAARERLSIELGHNRIDVISAYAGGRK